jgi:RNase adapter protein RapZ
MQLVVISGLSGSGKSVALAVLEDAGFYVVDNLPATLLGANLAFLRDSGYGRVAVTMDARSGQALRELPPMLDALKARGDDVRVLFLDARDDTLVRRYSETRRKHPLADGERTLEESIHRERELLEEIGERGHHIDTSDIAPNTLRTWVKEFVGIPATGTTLLFESFGFKQGIPVDADLVFDVRCLPNPFYDPKLRPLTGRDPEVVAFLDANGDAQQMLADIGDFVERWLPCFRRDNRAYLTVAIGCTGGMHRSVYFAEKLAARFGGAATVLVRHRGLRT